MKDVKTNSVTLQTWLEPSDKMYSYISSVAPDLSLHSLIVTMLFRAHIFSKCLFLILQYLKKKTQLFCLLCENADFK